jgi:predicted O-methyltransferase YrrM
VLPEPMMWMRDPAKTVGIPAIMTGLVDLCEYLRAQLVTPTLIYELGSFAGESSEVFAKYFQNVHCVDPWQDPCGAPSLEEVERSFDQRAARAGNIIKHKCGSVEMAAEVPDSSLDFVYIDAGAHTYPEVIRDLQAWWPKVRAGGFIGGHDFPIPELHAEATFPGVEQAVREFFGESFELKIFQDTSWLVRK